jgi:hypothetical protein
LSAAIHPRNLGDKVAHEALVGQRSERHLARLEPGGAGINRLAVELNHALLARIGIDAGKTDRQSRIVVDANPAQAVQHRLAGLEWNVKMLPATRIDIRPALDF